MSKEFEELKPCPFCGINPMIWDSEDDDEVLIEHPNTDCEMADHRSWCLESWNTRPTEDAASQAGQAIGEKKGMERAAEIIKESSTRITWRGDLVACIRKEIKEVE